MTCLIICRLIKRLNIPASDLMIQISKNAESQIGTSAELEKGDILSLNDLLYALMLPSGNDAAVALAEAYSIIT